MWSDLRRFWRDPGYWRWLWSERVGGQTKGALAVGAALAMGIAGYLGAQRLATEEATTLSTERVVTVVRTTGSNAPPSPRRTEVVTATSPPVTATSPPETDIVTIREDGRTIVVRVPGETVTQATTLRGAVERRVVTTSRTDTVERTETRDRLTTVTTPGATETVTREVTLPVRTVTDEVTVTDAVTVTDQVTVTDEVTVTEEITVTDEEAPSAP